MAKKSTRASAAKKSRRTKSTPSTRSATAKKSTRSPARKTSPRASATRKRSQRAAAPKPSERGLIVTLSGERGIDDVSRDLRQAGLTIDQVLEPIGIVTGTADPGSAAKLRTVKGVADVSPDQPVDIGPPDSDVQ